eukprot:957975-Rhodomonas_salina.1
MDLQYLVLSFYLTLLLLTGAKRLYRASPGYRSAVGLRLCGKAISLLRCEVPDGVSQQPSKQIRFGCPKTSSSA